MQITDCATVGTQVAGCGQGQGDWVRIQKRFALSPHLFFKATEMSIAGIQSASSVSSVEILTLCL